MSVHITSAVWSNERLGGSSKLVLLKLADCADDDGRNAYPSVARIARECGLGERTVQRILGALVDGGYLTITREADAVSHRPTTYRVRPGGGAKLAPGANGVSQMAPDPSGSDLHSEIDLIPERDPDPDGSGAIRARKRHPVPDRDHGQLEQVIRRK